ncbi:MAG: hypothetical protein CTY35_00375 [Methylotenera sp.]|uniref:hypothetical protein n=1 Tax=Methylotenera sp. TaxID=2051956 RepID=UPI000D4040D5|nr:hypothetical protein [Methylotenera sp.]PPC84810.1 MAG: hypothetical protein CTY38_00370 [Methylotenera sp.]PPD02170.1 MAG: hypothetical protein CTY35_00375 [Methylotenera sp.]
MSIASEHINPGLFVELCNPAWARVYNELSFNRKSHNDRLAWTSEVVRRQFVALAGFDPGKLQYADVDAQSAALRAARELEAALFVADENEELDGRCALDYAHGWLTARDWLHGADTSALPDADFSSAMATRFAVSSGAMYKEEFVLGFKRRVQLGHAFVA